MYIKHAENLIKNSQRFFKSIFFFFFFFFSPSDVTSINSNGCQPTLVALRKGRGGKKCFAHLKNGRLPYRLLYRHTSVSDTFQHR